MPHCVLFALAQYRGGRRKRASGALLALSQFRGRVAIR